MNMRLPGAGLLLLIVAVGGFSPVASTRADGPDQVSLGITPLEYGGRYFDLTMEPGELRELKVEIANHGAAQIGARTYAADAYSVIGGGFGARLDGESATGTTLWLAYSSQTIDLPAGEGLQRSFTITVPANAEPGEYLTSLVVQNAKPIPPKGGGMAINQVQRTVIAVAITVPGPRHPALTIGSVEHKYLASRSVIAATISNTGNVRVKPAGELLVSQVDGREVSRLLLFMDSVYAGDTTSVEVPFDRALLPGDYRVTLTLDYAGGAARAIDVPLKVPRATPAEANGAPTGAGQPVTVNQQQPAPQSRGVDRSVLVAGEAALALIMAMVVVWLRRRRIDARRAARLRGTIERRLMAVPSAGQLPSTPARGVVALGSAPPPTPLRYPLARAAGEHDDARPRGLSRAGAPPTPPTSSPDGGGRAAPPTTAGRNVMDPAQLRRFPGQKPSTPPSHDRDARQ